MPHAASLPVAITVPEAAPSGRRRISGICSTPRQDRMGDVVNPLGMTWTNPVPLHVNHNQKQPCVGYATLTATAAGITFEAEFHDGLPPGEHQTRVDEAYALCKAGVFRWTSIAIARARAVVDRLRDGGFHYKAGEIIEISLVPIPANADAGILAVKALSGDTPMGPNIPDTIGALETRKQNARNRMDQILDHARDEDRTCTPEESTEYDAVAAECKRLEGDLERWREREIVNKSLAVAVAAPPPPLDQPRPVPAPYVPVPTITIKSNLQPAARFVRTAMSLMYGQGDRQRSLEYAKQFRDTPEVEAVIKAAVPVGTSTDATWAGPLVPTVQNIAAEFITLLRAASVMNRIQGLVKTPFNVRIPAQTGGGTYGWVGEGLSKPVTKLAFAAVAVSMHKIAGISVFTEELARLSTPSAEEVVRNDMINGIVAFIDQQFIDPAVAEVSGVNPASITNGLTPITSTDDILADLNAIFAALATANIDPTGGTLLMSPANAFALATTTSNGMFVFPGITMEGGTLVGVNVVTSNVLGTNVVFIARNCVFVADEGGIQIDVSREASVQMDSAPATPPTPMVSLWQQNLVGLRADRWISWKRARATGVQLITGAGYTAPALLMATARRGGEAA